MANKGVNTLVVEAKENLINAINGCIKTGIPAAMVSIICESLLSDLNNNMSDHLTHYAVKDPIA